HSYWAHILPCLSPLRHSQGPAAISKQNSYINGTLLHFSWSNTHAQCWCPSS
ncbi:hypothetical protein P7K49_007943, partial [Saguinus oedipus]